MSGSYYIRVRKYNWNLWHTSHVDGKRKQSPVEKIAYPTLGFNVQMSVDEAKERCRQLNKEKTLLKNKVRLAAKRVTELRSVDETLFPQTYVDRFKALLEEENFGTETQLEKTITVFNFIQKLCNTLRILPSEYKQNSKSIYKYLARQKVSVTYSVRIISTLNRWGRFHSRITGTFYDDVRQARGNELSVIADAQLTKKGVNSELGVRTESAPLLPMHLPKLKDNLTEEQYNWMYLSLWLGLRPNEVDSLVDTAKFKIEFNKKLGKHVITIYQSKLQQLTRDKRWKSIPLVFEEQVACIAMIESKKIKRPLVKTIKRYIGQSYNLYAGRKGFVDLMLELGQVIEDISMWLGHASIQMTWRKYKDKMKVSYTDTNNLKKVSY